jgi:phage terminase large subunit
MRTKAEFPKKLEPIFQPCRYKILYGGRGGSKSWAIAMAFLIIGIKKPIRVLCARELQKSIKASVHRVLADQIIRLGLGAYYDVLDNSIRGKNGTEFSFEGLRHNADQIKSYEGVDYCWVEEAATVSRTSWRFLIPTIRKEGSEIWVSFNPELDEDETYQRFVANPPTNSIVIKVNYRDNPWFTDVLRQEMEDDKRRNHAEYLVTWEGHCRQSVEGAIYEDEMRMLHEENRIGVVPYNPKKPVNIFWDLGYGDQTSIWFIQKAELEYYAIDFYQNARKKLAHYVTVLQNRGYVYGTAYIPHDGGNNYLVGFTVEEELEALGWKVERVPRVQNIRDGLSAVRTVMPLCRFDKDKCAEGLQCLKRYKYKIDPDTKRASRLPDHDIYSDGADAFRTFATADDVVWETLIKPKLDARDNKSQDIDPFQFL